MDLFGIGSGMDLLAWRGMAYTLLLLNFVFACQLLLLQPLVSALGLIILLLHTFFVIVSFSVTIIALDPVWYLL